MRRNTEDARSNGQGTQILDDEDNELLGASSRLITGAKIIGEEIADTDDLAPGETTERLVQIQMDKNGSLHVGVFEPAGDEDADEDDDTPALDQIDDDGASIIQYEALKFARSVSRRLDGVQLDAEALAEVIAEATAAEVLDVAEAEKED